MRAETLADELEHIGKWPREHWKLAFQGQIRAVSEHDADVLLERLRAAAAAARMSERRGGALARAGRAWRALAPEGRLAAFAALGLFVTMFLPWYQRTRRQGRARRPTSDLTAFGVFSFVEAAVLLVALGVLALLFARAERRAFHLPGGDGAVVMGAGAWVALLLVWRLFDKPGVDDGGANVGVQWGIFFALARRRRCSPTPARACGARRPARAAPRRARAPPTEVPPPPPRRARPPTRVLPPERPRRRARPPMPEDQLTIPLPPSGRAEAEAGGRRASAVAIIRRPCPSSPHRSSRSPTACAPSATCRASRPRSSPTSRRSSASRCSSRARPASARPSWRRRCRASWTASSCACSATRASTRRRRCTSGTTASSCCGSRRRRRAPAGTRCRTTSSARSSCSRGR